VNRLHGRTEGFSPSGVRASACQTKAAQRCGCRWRAGTRRALVGTKERHHCKARERVATMAAAPAKRPARLDGRLSSDGGSARWRGAEQRSKNDTEDSKITRLGSASARRPGAQQGEGGGRLTLRSWTRRRGGGVEVRFGPRQENSTVKRKQGGRLGEGGSSAA
jgi:hypothetical protein